MSVIPAVLNTVDIVALCLKFTIRDEYQRAEVKPAEIIERETFL